MLGLAYKPLSHVIEAAQGAALAEACVTRGLRVVAFNPLVATLPGHDGVQLAGSAAEVADTADVVVMATPRNRRSPRSTGLASSLVVQTWRSSTRGGCCAIAFPSKAADRYHVLGRGPMPGADADAESRLASLWPGTPAR